MGEYLLSDAVPPFEYLEKSRPQMLRRLVAVPES
jgi:hypothetical protein